MLHVVRVGHLTRNCGIGCILLVLDFQVLHLPRREHLASFNLIKVCFYCIRQLSRKRLLDQIIKTSLQKLQKRRMLQKILRTYSFFRVLLEAFAQNYRHVRRDSFRYRWALLLDYVGHSCERIQFKVWRLPSQKFNRCTSQRPNVAC